MLNKRAMS